MEASALKGLRVLVVEDEALISIMLVDMLEQLGCAVIGPAATLDEAWPLVDARSFDVALIDVHLAGVPVFPLGERLLDDGIPIIIATGSGADRLPPRFQDSTLLPKPYSLYALEAALGLARASVSA